MDCDSVAFAEIIFHLYVDAEVAPTLRSFPEFGGGGEVLVVSKEHSDE